MAVARHPRPKELEGVPVKEIMKKFVGRYSEKRAVNEVATAQRTQLSCPGRSAARSGALQTRDPAS